MLPLLSDEDLQGGIVAGLLLHFVGIDLVRVQDVGLMQTSDSIILEYAANQNRVIVTHDRSTMTAYAQDRIDKGLHMPGLIVLEQFINFGKAIRELGTLAEAGDTRELGTLAEAGDTGDLNGQILFLS